MEGRGTGVATVNPKQGWDSSSLPPKWAQRGQKTPRATAAGGDEAALTLSLGK